MGWVIAIFFDLGKEIFSMDIKILLRICDESGQRFMGPGPYILLRGVEKHGSIRKAAISLNMSYAKAHRVLSTLEKELGIKLMKKFIGGHDHGGTELTEGAFLLLRHYEAMVEKINEAAQGPWHDFLQAIEEVKAKQSEGQEAKEAQEDEEPLS